MGEQNKMVMEIARKLKYNNVNGWIIIDSTDISKENSLLRSFWSV